MQTVIAIVGKIGAGKDEVAEYLSKKLGWPIFKISDPLKDELKRQGKEINRENLASLGNQWATQKSDDHIARLALEKHKGNLIISGPRQLGQIEYLKNHSNFTMIEITADDKIRFERVTARASVKEAKNLESFIKEELKNDAAPGKKVQILECIKLADYRIPNNSTLKDLYAKLDKIT